MPDAHRGTAAARDLEVAEERFRRVIGLRPTFAGAYENLGVVHKWRDEHAEALPLFRRACALDPDRQPQSGPMMAWDTMAVLMAGYESAEADSVFVDIREFIEGREFPSSEWPDASLMGRVFQRV